MTTTSSINERQVLKHLQAQLPDCLLLDRFHLKRRLQQVGAMLEQGKPVDKLMTELATKVQTSLQRRQLRQEQLPKPEYPAELPVSARKDEIAQAIAKHQVVIVSGETGSGKTTQLPKICLELGRGVAGLIGHTQPRRIAARSVASRIAQELKSPLGEAVGYKVRFNDRLSETTYIKLMTDGILLAETQGDRFLNAYDTIIIDEAHERSLNIDFLLGYLKQLLPRRPDLKVIVTSATIDAERFSRHFNGAPVIEVSGRTYPVEIRYRPLGSRRMVVAPPAPVAAPVPVVAQKEEAPQEDIIDIGIKRKAGNIDPSIRKWLEDDNDVEVLGQDIMGIQRKPRAEAKWLEEDDAEEAMEEAILDSVEQLSRLGGGDILVFLPGEREIRETADYLNKHLRHVEILPLFARLSIEDQQKVFRSSGGRRVVLATNVAETSLTVPGIKYVIDTGLARVNRYSARAKVEQLQVEKISQAAARQRAGRCGRVSNGICIRLYDEADFNHRPEFTDPEILRSSLAAVILRMAALKLGNVQDFPFIEAPSSRYIADGYQLLQELGAVDAEQNITDTGRQLARLPLDPRVSRMILEGKKQGCVREILIIASALAIQDPRERPMDKREAADQAHAKFNVEHSDFLGFIKLWEWYEDALKTKKSNKDLLNKCHSNFLSFLRLKEWRELYQQLREIAEELELKLNEQPASYEQVHRALLAGLLGNIGFKDGEADNYLGARGIRFHIAPGSTLKKARPKWVMAAELMETTKLYARCVARIEPDWIEPLARGLTQSHYSDPRWDRKAAQVVAWERVSLYGLTVVPRRRVHYGPINPQESREIFIREALANMEFDTRAPFFAANRKLIAEIEELEHKARRQDVLVDEHTLFAFYDAIIPAGIVNGAGFEKWRQEAERETPRLLYLTRDHLMRHGAAGVTEVQFPESLELDGVKLPLKYRFEPGHPLDGVTATVPLALLNQLNPVEAEWLVPGMIREKVTALIKALPKTLRRVCVPVPDFVTGFLETATRKDGALLPALASYIQQRTGLKLSASEWQADALDAHLYMNFRVVDEKNRELGSGRDWHALKAQLGQAAQLTFRSNSPGIEKAGLKQWDFGDLPPTLSFSRDGRQLTGYPALEDNGDSVAIKLFDTELAARQSHRAGVRRLMRFELKEQMKQLEKGLPGFNQYALQLRSIMSPEELREDMLVAISDRAFIGEDELPRNSQDFMALKARARTRLPAVVEGAGRLATAIATEYTQLTQKLNAAPASLSRVKKELEGQLARLLPKRFFSATPWDTLQHLPRYIKAMRLRLEKYPGAIERDTRSGQAVQQIWERWESHVQGLRKANQEVPPAVLDYRWLIEELRVSLFAQELKTPFPVSVKRLDKAWEDMVRA
ncbi:ATP-dependent RNA helicase HrpA [Methylobacillus flagellatus]|uniref:ATP-dependent helicase HrpA n=1 Tax=Methylobacillus flagellatus (strain ATCC 51484 / DSM 6875 / VKM B-1610 / KT) TaxID=265072 RepID=Q1H207_METFK|nr:ATP-dependent RNA helicase HrpA [Methylobacillus flagellatus]ABE49480.1 ATP-dependent helicase HrpA [Methylobacillus flagellatus KT]